MDSITSRLYQEETKISDWIKRIDSRVWVILGLSMIFLIAFFYGSIIYAPSDDAYIFYVYAKNFVNGNGLTFNGEQVWGFSSIIWVWLLAGVGLIWDSFPIIGVSLSLLSGGFALWATYYLGRNMGLRRVFALIPSLLLAVTGDFSFYMWVGLEQVLFVGLVALSTAIVLKTMKGGTPGVKTLIGIAVLLAMMILTRPEGVLISALLLLIWWGGAKSFRPPFVCGLILSLFVLLVFVGLYSYYGDWLPNTYYAKSNAGLANVFGGMQYMKHSLKRYSLIGAVVIIAFIHRLITRSIRINDNWVSLYGMSLVWLVYVTLQGGDNMVGGRMLIPVFPLVYSALIVMAAGRSQTIKRGKFSYLKRGVVLGFLFFLCVGMIALYKADTRVARHAGTWSRDFLLRRAAGLYLRQNFPPNTLVALNTAGIIPFYSELPTIDMLGLNDRHIAHYGKRDRSLRFAHQAGDGLYVLERKPAIILLSGCLGAEPNAWISDREIWASPEFHANYIKVKWENIGTAFIREEIIRKSVPDKSITPN